MSEQLKPRKGDKVRVTFDAEFLADDLGNIMVDVADGMGPIHIALPSWATVEVLERADDPRKDEPGTVRVSPGGAQYVKVETREGVEPWVFLRGGSGASTQFVRMPDGGVVGWPYAAPVTVTPAAEAAGTAERAAGCQNHWPVSPKQETRPLAPDTVLHVQHTVWKSLVAYLDSVGVAVLNVTTFSDKQPTFYMEPKAGAWGE